MLEGRLLRRIVEEVGTPVYVYDQDRIGSNIQRFKSIEYPNLRIYFATMANSNVDILRILRENDIGVFVNSLKHLKAARDAGYNDNVTFTVNSSITLVISFTACVLRFSTCHSEEG